MPRATRKHRRRRRKLPASLRARTSSKIAKLIREGRPRKQAAAIAYGMARAGRLGPRGGYRRK